MLSIKIEIGFDKGHTGQKKEPDIKKAVFLAALLDSTLWIADTAFLLKIFYAAPLSAVGLLFLCGVFLMYLAYLFIKKQLLTKKYGKEVYHKEFGHAGILLAAVSAALVVFMIVRTVNISL